MELRRRWVALGAFLAIACANATGSAHAMASPGATLTIDPPNLAVAKGQTFAIQVMQDAPVATSGAQASVDFDTKILQLVSVSRGSAYAGSPIFAPLDIAADIKAANTSGHLAQVAAAFTPPDAVPAGSASFLVVRFQAVGCGQTDISLPTSGPSDAQMIGGLASAYGQEVSIGATTGSHVTTCVGADLVTGSDIAVTDASANSGFPLPIAAIGALGAAALALAGVLALRSRRRAAPDDDLVQ